MSWRLLRQFNPRAHLMVYFFASLSNLLLSIPEYFAVRSAFLSNLPVKGSTAGFVALYGLDMGLAVDALWRIFAFEALLTILVIVLAATSLVQKGWRWFYVFGGMMIFGFVGYSIGAKFLSSLSWISILQNSGVDASAVYSDLFWFGFGAAACYVGMILVMRRAYDKLLESKTDTLFRV